MLASFPTFNGLAPSAGPKIITWQPDFSTLASVALDLTVEELGSDFGGVQGVYIDHADGAAALTLTFNITQQRLVIPAKTQGFYPLFIGGILQVTATATPAADYRPTLLFVNVPMPAHSWTTP